MDRDSLSPPQLRVVDELLALGAPRPTFARDLGARLVDELEARLRDVAEPLGRSEIYVNKRSLALALGCEAHHVASREAGFGGWSPAAARGTVAHKAIELAVHLPSGAPPLVAVDGAIESFLTDDGDWGPGRWLADASPAELAELRADVNDLVTKFEECWPPLVPEWRPRTESAARAELCDDRIVMSGKVDLALGRARGNEARVLVVDLKTGRASGVHLDDLRYYALLHAIRTGVPPFRVAGYYLDSAAFTYEDVTEELLFDVALPRVVEGVTRVVELHLGARAARATPGPLCSWCVIRRSCDEGLAYARQRDELDDVDVT